jgi:hypothetical protein
VVATGAVHRSSSVGGGGLWNGSLSSKAWGPLPSEEVPHGPPAPVPPP